MRGSGSEFFGDSKTRILVSRSWDADFKYSRPCNVALENVHYPRTMIFLTQQK